MRSSIQIEPEIWSLFRSHERDGHPIFGEICPNEKEREIVKMRREEEDILPEGKERTERRSKEAQRFISVLANKNQY